MKQLSFLALSFATIAICAFYLDRVGRTQSRDAEAGAAIVINFDASQVTEGVWYGPASGDVTGNVTVESIDDPPELFRGTWSGRTRWQVAAGTSSFTSEMSGKINTYNGTMLMVGKVIDGSNAGARATAQAQITAINPHHFVGTVRIDP